MSVEGKDVKEKMSMEKETEPTSAGEKARQYPDYSPVYEVLPVLRTPHVDPGDSVEIDIYFSGYGTANRGKLYIAHQQPYALDEEETGTVISSVGGVIEDNEYRSLVTGEPAFEEGVASKINVNASGTYIGLTEVLFSDDIGGRIETETLLPQVIGEGTYDEIAPIQLILNTSDDAPPGDYSIDMVLTYGTKDSLKQSVGEVPIHVNNRREQLEPWPTRAGILAVLIGLLSLIHQTGFFSWLGSYIPL